MFDWEWIRQTDLFAHVIWFHSPAGWFSPGFTAKNAASTEMWGDKNNSFFFLHFIRLPRPENSPFSSLTWLRNVSGRGGTGPYKTSIVLNMKSFSRDFPGEVKTNKINKQRQNTFCLWANLFYTAGFVCRTFGLERLEHKFPHQHGRTPRGLESWGWAWAILVVSVEAPVTSNSLCRWGELETHTGWIH